ncbi:MAG: aspartate dehydrogenase [Lachnospiraceae bacterium]|nr:aspartate dehydrogenase [Lachnospiraceae bacterium]
MGLFKRDKIQKLSYDRDKQRPVIKCSICNGEQVAGFLNKDTGKFEDIMLIMNEKDLQRFVSTYDIKEELEKIY